MIIANTHKLDLDPNIDLIFEEPTSHYKEKILKIDRVTKVVKGGKRLRFRAILIVGDKISKVGLGVGKSSDINMAIEKASLSAQKKFIKISHTKEYSIHKRCEFSASSSKILIRPAKHGRGIIASGAIRAVLEMGGIKNAYGKQLGSKNMLNNARATINALAYLENTHGSFTLKQ